MKSIWRFFKSLKLTIYLCIAYIVVSIWGSLSLQKNPKTYEYIDYQVLFDWLKKVGWQRIDKIFWIILLIFIIFLLAINTFVCTIDRISAIWKKIFRVNLDINPSFIDGLKFNKSKITQGDAKIITNEICSRLQKKGYRILQGETAPIIYADKNRFFTFAEIIVHLAFVLLLFGHLITSLFGTKNPNNLFWQNWKNQIPNKNFSILLHDIDISFYPNGQPKDFAADIGIFKDNTETVRKKIKLNEPLFYKGEVIYLVNFGFDPYIGKYVYLTINHDPGANLVLWAGIFTMLGLWGTFFITYRRIWIYLTPQENDLIEIKSGGWVNQIGYDMEQEMEGLFKG